MKQALALTATLLFLAGITQGDTLTQVPPAASLETGIQAGELELEYFGFDPSAFFFFTGNTQYDYTGAYELQIIAAAVNPAGATSLEGVTINEVTFIIDNSGDISNVVGIASQSQALVPEPTAWDLTVTGLAVSILLLRYALPRGTKFNDAEFMQ